MDTIQQKQYFLDDLQHELITAWNMSKQLGELAALDTGVEVEFQVSNDDLWRKLIRSIPKIPQPIHIPYPLAQKISVDNWISGLVTLFKGSLFGKPVEVWLPQPVLKDVLVWGYLSPWQVNRQNVQGDSFWFEFLWNINSWRTFVKATLNQHLWSSNSNQVRLALCWDGSFKSVDTISIQGIQGEFWVVSLENNVLDEHYLLDIEASLIRAQLVAWHRNSRFTAELREKRLWMTLEMPQANLVETPAPDILSDKVLEAVVDHIIRRAWPRYQKVSKELELLTATEIDQWQDSSIVNEIELWVPFKLLSNILERLAAARVNYRNMLIHNNLL